MDSGTPNTDRVEFWNEVWDTVDPSETSHDALLQSVASEMRPGRALDVGCGAGGNAIWLAERGWEVTGLDFSEVAVQKCKEVAANRGLSIEFIASDASTYEPKAQYQLVISFYIQLPPDQRRQILSNAASALAPGGKLLFVSHDRSAPPPGWDADELNSLTTPDEVVVELPSLRIERAEVIEEIGAHMADMPDPEEGDDHHHGSHGHHSGDSSEGECHSHGASTVVVAMRPGGSS